MKKLNLLTSIVVFLSVSAVSILAAPGVSHAQDGSLIKRNDKVNNVIIIDSKIVVRQQLPGEKSGIRLNTETITPETFAKEQAIENRLEGDVVPNKPSLLVKGSMDNTVQAEGVYAIKRSKDSKACVEIGTVGNDQDCQSK